MQAVMGQSTFRRREMDIEDYVSILRRNSGWLVGPIMAGIVIATVVACFWPNTYVSNAIIKIVPPTVPARLVPNNVDVPMSNRITQLRTELMSHANLTNVIRTYGLYQKEQLTLPLEDIVESMKRVVKIDPLIVGLGTAEARSTAIIVAFSYEQRYKAQAVTKYFVTKIIDENQRDASSRSKMMTNFVQEKFNDAEAKLQAADNALVAFKQSNLGRMPEELTGNAQLMMSYDTRSSMLNQKLTTIRTDVTILEGELRGWIAKRGAAADNGGSGSASSTAPLQALSNSDPVLFNLNTTIAQLERDRARLLLNYTAIHPDVIKADKMLEIAKKERDERMNSRLALPTASAKDSPAAPRNDVRPKSKEEADAEANIARIQSKLKALGNEEEQVIRDISATEKRAGDVQAMLRSGPAGQQQYADLLRDQMAARKEYETWKGNLSISKTSSDLQDNKQGETLEILDSASLPTNPTSPNRPLFLGAGLFAGIFIGGGLIAFREIRDTSIKSLKDVQAYTQFNVLGSVPLLENDMVVRRRRRMGILGWASASLVSIITMAGATYYYLNVVTGR